MPWPRRSATWSSSTKPRAERVPGSERERGDWDHWVDTRLEGIRTAGRWRRYRDLDARGPAGLLTEEGQEVVTFASNDYLGLTVHPEVVAAAHAALDRWGAGSGGSRLITGGGTLCLNSFATVPCHLPSHRHNQLPKNVSRSSHGFPHSVVAKRNGMLAIPARFRRVD